MILDSSQLINFFIFFLLPQASSSAPTLLRTCDAHWNDGKRNSSTYRIFVDDANSFDVFCDFTSEIGWAWTLVMSQSHQNRAMPQFRVEELFKDAPLNQDSPNWESYRLSLNRMTYIHVGESGSSHWRITCSYPTHGVDYRDYVRANFTELNPLNFSGAGTCVRMEYLDVRGHDCVGCTSGWWSRPWLLHLDSSVALCEFGRAPGNVVNEDNFGYYHSTNDNFRCSSSSASTTNFWFGTPLTSFMSCYDYWSRGVNFSKPYRIHQNDSLSFKVICDFNSEPGWVWTLVMSHSHRNRAERQFKDDILQFNAPMNEDNPNRASYRLSFDRMVYIKAHSTHWRITCKYVPNQNVNYTDYVRANFTDFNPLAFKGRNTCKRVEFLNVRGHECTGCTSSWRQKESLGFLHHESSKESCEFGSSSGYVHSEDNFGYYKNSNPAFRCSSSDTATTNLWFGRRNLRKYGQKRDE